MYINREFEIDILKAIKESLNYIEENSLVKYKIKDFDSLLNYKHEQITLKYNDVLADHVLDWSSRNGFFLLYYRPYKKIHFTVKHFYIKDYINKIKN